MPINVSGEYAASISYFCVTLWKLYGLISLYRTVTTRMMLHIVFIVTLNMCLTLLTTCFNLFGHYYASVHVPFSTSHNPMGLQGLLQG
jgi:uncharacterized membrane protein